MTSHHLVPSLFVLLRPRKHPSCHKPWLCDSRPFVAFMEMVAKSRALRVSRVCDTGALLPLLKPLYVMAWLLRGGSAGPGSCQALPRGCCGNFVVGPGVLFWLFWK